MELKARVMRKVRNSETTPLVTSLIILFAGVAMMLIPAVIELDMMQYGFGLIFIGGFLAIAGVVSGIVFAVRFRKFLKLSSGQDVIAHWTHSEGGFEEQVQKDFEDRRRRNRTKLGIMLFFIVVITATMAAVGYSSGEGDAMPLFVGTMVVIGMILSIIAFLAPKWDRRRALRNARDTYIAEHSLYTQGTLHSWGTVASRLVGLSLEKDGPREVLTFSIDYAAHVGFPQYINHTVEVPVPPGEEERAREIVERLSSGLAEG